MPRLIFDAIAQEMAQSLAETTTLNQFAHVTRRGIGLISSAHGLLSLQEDYDSEQAPTLERLVPFITQEVRDFGGVEPEEVPEGLIAFSPYYLVLLRDGAIIERTRFGELKVRLRPYEILARADAGIRTMLDEDAELFSMMAAALGQKFASLLEPFVPPHADWPKVSVFLKRREGMNETKYSFHDVEEDEKMFMSMHLDGLVMEATHFILNVFNASNGTAMGFLETLQAQPFSGTTLHVSIVGKPVFRSRPTDDPNRVVPDADDDADV